MTEKECEQHKATAADEEEEEETTPGYKAPAPKSLAEIQDLDQEDESLRKYKETLLGQCSGANKDPNAPNVEVTRMTLVCSSKELHLDLHGDLSKLTDTPIVLKEGVEYKVKITFRVNRDIVSGLRYLQNTFRKGIRVDKSNFMVGSYGPRETEYEFLTPVEEAPKGMVARGNYTIKSKFTDDDKTDILSWEWMLSIKKEWD